MLPLWNQSRIKKRGEKYKQKSQSLSNIISLVSRANKVRSGGGGGEAITIYQKEPPGPTMLHIFFSFSVILFLYVL